VTAGSEPRNRLAGSASPYLRAAADQPVAWWPWCADAFERARVEDKPILLDIGAAWCHWCHVMDRESYEDPAVAELVNRHFVAVKVDRDERPDVDARYQRAVQAMAGEGGWPLTVFLTPDGEAFYGGTYFPPEDRFGRPSFRRVLEAVADLYRTRRERVAEAAARLREALARDAEPEPADAAEPSPRWRDEALDAIARAFDVRYGGFGDAPKFPHPTAVDLALDAYVETRLDWVAEIVRKTLAGMAKGGIHDQLGGGFHRYATDARWIVPHFEKMAYDNSELLRTYARAYAVFGDPLYREVAEGIVRWVLEVMHDPAGGFYASQDADVGPDDDGSYWTWTVGEARAAIEDDLDFRIAQRAFDLYEEGEMRTAPDRNVLWVAREPAALAQEFGVPEGEVRERLARAKAQMKLARDRRPAPAVDRSLYAGWNAMMASACLEAWRYVRVEEARAAALRALHRVWAEAVDPARGVRHRLGDPSSPLWLEDHVQLAAACLDAFEVTQEAEHLERAGLCLDWAARHFWDEARGAFADVPADDGEPLGYLRHRWLPIEDQPTPAPNGVAALALARYAAFAGDEGARRRAERLVRTLGPRARRLGLFAATLIRAADAWLRPPAHAVVVGPAGAAEARALVDAALGVYRPRLHVRAAPPGAAPDAVWPKPLAPLLRASADGRARGYFCAGTACAPPADDPAAYRETVATFGLPRAR
jgi:uncharacterized protein YyaL (SSP411 family)